MIRSHRTLDYYKSTVKSIDHLGSFSLPGTIVFYRNATRLSGLFRSSNAFDVKADESTINHASDLTQKLQSFFFASSSFSGSSSMSSTSSGTELGS